MALTMSGELLDRIVEYAGQTRPGHSWIALEGGDAYGLIASEILAAAEEHGGEDLVLIADRDTAERIESFPTRAAKAQRVLLLGGASPRLAQMPNVRVCKYLRRGPQDECFVLALSSSINLAAVCRRERDLVEGGYEDHGGWTGLRRFVRYIAETLLAETDAQLPSKLPEKLDEEGTEIAQACILRLMAILTGHYASQQRSMEAEKSDLSSVLEILKSISSKRHAHDILYAFVEQIAKVIGIDRCSVVRVWGSENRGHVLASHEDESVNDLAIDLQKYPELMESMRRRAKVVINDAATDPLTRRFAEDLKRADISSILVVPVVLFDQDVGSFILRAVRRKGRFTPREVSFCEIVGEAAGNALERAHLFESIQSANQRLELLAITDGLTGLNNHRYFQERLQDEFDRAIRYCLPLACMLFDIDDFKKVNDTYGHLQGDSVLKEIAARTLSCVRRNDIVARYGGEEFVVIMPQTDALGARQQARRVLSSISSSAFAGLPESVKVTASIGVSVLNSETMKDCEQFLREADENLYIAKSSGKNCVVMNREVSK